MTDHKQDNRGVNRRRLLQQVGIAGIGVAGVGTATATSDDSDESEKRGTVTFTESAVTHSIEFPSAAVRRHSLVTVNTLPEHVVFEDERVLSYTHHTTRETAETLEESQGALWNEAYQELPLSEAGSTQHVWLGVDTLDRSRPRLTKGALLEDDYRPPGFSVVQDGETVQVTAGETQAALEPGDRFQQELPPREVGILLSQPAEGIDDDTQDDPELEELDAGDASGDESGPFVQQLPVRPTVQIKHYGEVEIRAPADWTPRELAEPPVEVPDR